MKALQLRAHFPSPKERGDVFILDMREAKTVGRMDLRCRPPGERVEQSVRWVVPFAQTADGWMQRPSGVVVVCIALGLANPSAEHAEVSDERQVCLLVVWLACASLVF